MAKKYPIHHVSFPTRHLVTSTFLRFQEHYESPEFAGKVFTLEEFMDWYAATRGAFTYCEDWSGFNLPSSVFAPFRAGKFDPLTRKEAWLLGLFDGIEEPFYVIGTVEGGDALGHEIVHGLFSTAPGYADEVRATLATHPLPAMRLALGKMGYAEHVFDDELNAYLLTGLSKELVGKDRASAAKAKKALRAIFIGRFGIDPGTPAGEKALAARIHHHRFPAKRARPR